MGAGNSQFKCPMETTQGTTPFQCVMKCTSNYELRLVGGAQRCVNKDDPSVSVHLNPQPAVLKLNETASAPFDINSLKGQDGTLYSQYSAEADRYKKELTIADGSIDQSKKVKAAADRWHAAAKADPGGPAENSAKMEYLTLTNNEEEVEYLKSKAFENEVNPIRSRYIDEFVFLNNQGKQQQNTIDLINSVKDNLFSVKDDVEYSVNTFGKQIDEIRNQINKNKRTREEAVDYGSWFMFLLNGAIVIALLFTVFTVGRKVMGSIRVPTTPTQGAPARPPASPETTAFFNAFLKHITPA